MNRIEIQGRVGDFIDFTGAALDFDVVTFDGKNPETHHVHWAGPYAGSMFEILRTGDRVMVIGSCRTLDAVTFIAAKSVFKIEATNPGDNHAAS